MVARRATFRSPGWDHVPETYEDLTKCCDDLLAKGIIPFGCAGKETWCVTEYLEPIIIKTIGFEALNKIFAGEATWNDPDIAGAVTTFQEMINKGYFDPNGAALGNDEVKANFLAGKTAFYQNGSRNTGEVDQLLGYHKADSGLKSAISVLLCVRLPLPHHRSIVMLAPPISSYIMCLCRINAAVLRFPLSLFEVRFVVRLNVRFKSNVFVLFTSVF